MPRGSSAAGLRRTVREVVALTAASACLGAVVAYGASRAGGGATGLRGQVAVEIPKADGGGQQDKAPPRPSFIEKPEAISISFATQFRFHVPPRRRRHFQCRHDGGTWQDCCPTNSFELTPSSASPSSPLAIPAGGSVGLPTDEVSAPTIGMRNLPVDQDACQGARLQLVFDGEARG